MNLFTKKQDTIKDKSEDYSTLSFPFLEKENNDNRKDFENIQNTNILAEEPDDVKVYNASVSPLDSVKKNIKENLTESDVTAVPDVKRHETLLEKCMPFIYDEEGVSQVDTTPDYVLESVEDIIHSAEQRANAKINALYKLSDKKQTETSDLKIKVNKAVTTEKVIEEMSLPKRADILFDDFSGKRTVVTGGDSVTTTYSKLTEKSSSDTDALEGKTIVMPSIKESTLNTMEEIVSHTRPINIKDAPAIKSSKPFNVTIKNDDSLPFVDDDFYSFDDVNRIGSKLKAQRRLAFIKLSVTVFITIVSALFTLVLPDSIFGGNAFLPSLIQLGLLLVASLVNINIFISIKSAFTKKATLPAPIAISTLAMIIYMVYGVIFGIYPSDPALLPLISLLAFDFFWYKRSSDILNNFRIVASRNEKNALALIDNQVIASSMARSSIMGEVLIAGTKRTRILTDFMRFTSSDTPFGNNLGIVTIIFSILTLIFSLIIGVSYRSFHSFLYSISSMLCIFAMPTFAISEFAPLSNLSNKLYKMGSLVFGKYSASRIEQVNAVVVTSAELFPKGSIELYNMKPLGANNIDSTLTAAAAVAEAINSPLLQVFDSFIPKDEKKPVADTVKYEDNLGISGWVKDDHFFIGNRTLMEAHGIRVPALEVDRKILHSGYFPVYVAVGQRACALLVIKYRPNKKVGRELGKIVNSGITLLIDSCDANITAEMISDYYNLYLDSIKIMDNLGVNNYAKEVNYSESCRAHAATIGKANGFLSLINGCLKLHTQSNIMYAFHIVLSALASVIYTLTCLNGTLSLMPASVILLIETICLAILSVTYFFSKD